MRNNLYFLSSWRSRRAFNWVCFRLIVVLAAERWGLKIRIWWRTKGGVAEGKGKGGGCGRRWSTSWWSTIRCPVTWETTSTFSVTIDLNGPSSRFCSVCSPYTTKLSTFGRKDLHFTICFLFIISHQNVACFTVFSFLENFLRVS